MAVDVNCQDGRCPRGDCSLDFFGIESIIIGFDVDEDGPDLVPVQRMRCRHKGVWSGDDFSCNPHPLQSDLQRQRPVIEETEIVRLEETAQFLSKRCTSGP